MSKTPSIPSSEYASRRDAVLKSLKSAVGVVFAGDADPSLHGAYRPNPHFEYLTGVTDEPGAILVLEPKHPVASRRTTLYLKPLDPEVEKWDGFRHEVGAELRKRCGVQTIMRTRVMPRFMRDAAMRAKKLACLHDFATHVQPVSPDLALFRQLSERIPGVVIEDHTQLLPSLRAKKSVAERKVMQHAIDITAGAFEQVMRTIAPGMNEFAVQETLEHHYRSNGSRGPAFNTICGGGFNATVLHYRANDQPLVDGDLIVIDSGADFAGYSADVTRTIPVNGVFTERQAEIYNLVLKALHAATKVTKAGCTFGQVDKAARDLINKAGYGDFFFHGIGHHLGLETHDATPEGPIPAGAVITIEPGIYLPDEGIGVRIEDDVLVTKDGPKVLTKRIPKTVDAIEKAMARD